jgi:hypothetical protein
MLYRLKLSVTMERFRPNIIVENISKPFAEDDWKEICFIGEKSQPINMKIVKPCARCTIPTIDPSKGVFDTDKEPMNSMKSFRQGHMIGYDEGKFRKEV